MTPGRGTLMAKFDVATADRNVAIHPEDRPLLGMRWRGQFFVDMVLPFGLRSAPFIFTAIADLVEWILVNNSCVNFLRHYLDDFLTLVPPASPICHNNLQKCVHLCKKLGLPLHPDKLEGPATCLTILGIELDSEKLQARLPSDKRDTIIALLEEWSTKRFCRRREQESLIGHLHRACKVAPQGRTFLRRMINLLCALRRDDHPIRLNQEFQRDLTWWRELFQTWDGLSFFCMPTWAPLPDFQVSSDASGSLGHGAIFKSHWFCGAWLAVQRSSSIAYKELFPIIIAASLRGSQWVSRRVEFLCNESVVAVLKSGTPQDQSLMLLLRYLSMLAVRHSFLLLPHQFVGFRRSTGPDSCLPPSCSSDALTQRCQFLFTQGLAPSTRRVYLSAQRRFINFCHQDGRVTQHCILPLADEETLMRFATVLGDNLNHSSIKVYLSAVRSLYIVHGFPDPLVGCLRLQRLLRGIKRVQGPVTPRHLPITIDQLRVIQRSLDLSTADPVMLWAACCLGFFGFFTSWGIHGNYLSQRGATSGPLFRFSSGRPLTRQQLSSSVQSILHAAGYSGSYSGHSFRIGAATNAAARGVPDHLIKTLGRSSSDAYQIYIWTPVNSIVRVSSQLVA
ncbi:hypothetical protein ACROYT_G030129 [Oculina patagonica]